MIDIAKLRADVNGFRGRFEFQTAHTEDRGIGNIADFVDIDDRIVYFGEGDDHPEDAHVIVDQIEPHVGEPVARMLNALPELLATYEAALAFERGSVVDEDELRCALRKALGL